MASFELFIDLLYVGIIAVIGDRAAEDPTGVGFLRFAITFILGWKMWSDLTIIISWFGEFLLYARNIYVPILMFKSNHQKQVPTPVQCSKRAIAEC